MFNKHKDDFCTFLYKCRLQILYYSEFVNIHHFCNKFLILMWMLFVVYVMFGLTIHGVRVVYSVWLYLLYELCMLCTIITMISVTLQGSIQVYCKYVFYLCS